MPYNRYLSAFLKFVTDVTDPYLNLFRRILPPVRLGGAGLDLSPIVATFVLIIVSSDRRRPHQGDERRAARPRRSPPQGSSSRIDQATKQLAISNIERGEQVNIFFGLDLTNTRNSGVAFGAFAGGGTVVAILIGVSLALLVGYFALHRDMPLPVAARRAAAGRRAGQPRGPSSRRRGDRLHRPRGVAGLQRGRRLHRGRRVPAALDRGGEPETASDELIAAAEDAGLRLDAFLAARAPRRPEPPPSA